MKKTLLSLVAIVAIAGYANAQTTLADFEGTIPYQYTFGGSDFSVEDNPSKTGINTSNKVAMTQKAAVGAATWGGAAFPIGGTIDFAPGEQTFTMDVYSAVAGTVTFKIEHGSQADAEIPMEYTTPGQWQTLTFSFLDRDPSYAQIVLFMGFNSVATDVWYYDNIKGPAITVGAAVDFTFQLTDLGGTTSSVEMELSDAPGTKIALNGTPGIGATWSKIFTGVTGSTIKTPVTYTIFVNGASVPEMTDQAFPMAGSAASVIAKNYGTAPVGVNLINNGTFDGIEGAVTGGGSGKNWGMWSGNGATASVVNGVLNASPVASGDNWQMQFEQYNFAIENNKTYTASFDAWSTADRVITLSIEDPSNSYALLGTTTDARGTDVNGVLRSKWNVNITTTKTRYDLVLSVDKIVANTNQKFVFLMAQTADMVYIDNVSLMETTNVSVSENKANAVRFYPNPVQTELHLQLLDAKNRLILTDMTGHKLLDLVTPSVNTLDMSSFKPGMYMLRVENSYGIQNVKIIKK